MTTSSVQIDLKKLLNEHFELPALPTMVAKILGEIDAGTAGSTEIADLIATDAGITASILKVVNSAYYGLPCRIGRVRHAVAYLGLSEVQRLLLAVAVMDHLVPKSRADFDEFWRHSFHTALSAKYVSKTFAQGHEAEELHVCALLHDVGKLVYMKFLPQEFAEIMECSKKDRVLFATAEEKLGHPPHGVLGAMLCEKWNLPDALSDVCLDHSLEALHQVDPISQDPNSRAVVTVANVLVNLANMELSDEVRNDASAQIMRVLECTDKELLLVLGEVYELRAQVEGLVSQMG